MPQVVVEEAQADQRRVDWHDTTGACRLDRLALVALAFVGDSHDPVAVPLHHGHGDVSAYHVEEEAHSHLIWFTRSRLTPRELSAAN